MKIIIYTCNIGHYDRFQNNYVREPKISYLYFSDTDFKILGWEKKMIKLPLLLDNTRKARFVKVNSHLVLPEHDISVWIDSSFSIKKPLKSFILRSLKGFDMVGYKHGSINFSRNCIYEEADVCINNKLDDKAIIDRQMSEYIRDKYPPNNGLLSSGFIIRRNNKKVKEFNELWWSHIKEFSKRDQLSQCYAAWKTGLAINVLTRGNIYSNEYLRKQKHILKRV